MGTPAGVHEQVTNIHPNDMRLTIPTLIGQD